MSKKTSDELFIEAYDALKREKFDNFHQAFLVELSCSFPSLTAGKYYQAHLIITLDGKILNKEMYAGYTFFGIPDAIIKNGFFKTNKISQFPLIDKYTTQVKLKFGTDVENLVTIKVNSVLIDPPKDT